MKIRFETTKGALTVEDLWDLPLTSARYANLNDIAKGINRELKASGEEDFVSPATKADETLALKLAVVKHIIGVRLAENEEAKLIADKRAQKEKLLELIARKQDQELEGKSLEDLQKMVEAL
jgi:hypothetical protein